MRNMLNAFWRDDTGSELVEWAVIVVILLGSSVVFFVVVRTELLATIRSIFLQMQKAPVTDYGP